MIQEVVANPNEEQIDQIIKNKSVSTQESNFLLISKTKKFIIDHKQALEEANQGYHDWIKELQDIFYDTIDIFQEIMQQKKNLKQMDDIGKKQFEQRILNDLKKVDDNIDQVVNNNDFHDEKANKIKNTIKMEIKEIRNLIHLIYDIEIDQNMIHIDQYVVGKKVPAILGNIVLQKEVRQSNIRLDQIKKGLRLSSVLEKDLVKLYDKEILQNNLQYIIDSVKEEIELVKADEQASISKNTSQNDLSQREMDMKQKKEYEKKLKEQEKMKILQEKLTKFKEKKDKMYALINNYINLSCEDPNFDLKYKNLYQYFKERYSLVSFYLGSEAIEQFMQKGKGIEQQDEQDIKKNEKNNDQKYIDMGLGHTQKYVDTMDVKIVKKIQKINEELRIQLIKDDKREKKDEISDLNAAYSTIQVSKQINRNLAQVPAGQTQGFIQDKKKKQKQQQQQNYLVKSQNYNNIYFEQFWSEQQIKNQQKYISAVERKNKILYSQSKPLANIPSQIYRDPQDQTKNSVNFLQDSILEDNLKQSVMYQDDKQRVFQSNQFYRKMRKSQHNASQSKVAEQLQLTFQQFYSPRLDPLDEIYPTPLKVTVQKFEQNKKEDTVLYPSQQITSNTTINQKDSWALYLTRYGTSKYRLNVNDQKKQFSQHEISKQWDTQLNINQSYKNQQFLNETRSTSTVKDYASLDTSKQFKVPLEIISKLNGRKWKNII